MLNDNFVFFVFFHNKGQTIVSNLLYTKIDNNFNLRINSTFLNQYLI